MELSVLYIALVLTFPLISGLVSYFVPIKGIHALSIAFLSVGLVLAALMPLFPSVILRWSWMSTIEFGIRIDGLSALLITLVYFISLLVHLFSLHYMKGDSCINRYYFKLGFFTSSMLGLLAADHFILLFIFWELVGFSSYLLIGFWFKEKEKSNSARTAFMVNRVADAGLLIAIILLITVFDISFISEIESIGAGKLAVFTGIMLSIGAFGKSAQFPFYGWLNKAMAGPTPVSALIHAATMVTAGVYLLVRVFPMLTEDVLIVIAIMGSLTAFTASMSAMFQNDIKAILAYSTISQLGLMIMAVGVGAYQSSIFHLWTHAFFKAGLFLAAGNVIHFMHEMNPEIDPQDMRNMGGLRKHLPYTFIAFVVCGGALAGLPFTSGFLSKESIFAAAMNWQTSLDGGYMILGSLVFFSAFTTVIMTPLYTTMQILLVFFDKPRTELIAKIKDSLEPFATVLFPLALLSIGAVWVFSSLSPFDSHGWYFNKLLFGNSFNQQVPDLIELFILVASLLFTISGIVMAYFAFKPGSKKILAYKESSISKGTLLHFWHQGWYIERLYDFASKSFLLVSNFAFWIDRKVVDRTVNGVGVGVVVLGKVTGAFDKYVIDGFVNLIASFFKSLGRFTTRMQAPGIQTQIAVMLFILIGLMYWFLF